MCFFSFTSHLVKATLLDRFSANVYSVMPKPPFTPVRFVAQSSKMLNRPVSVHIGVFRLLLLNASKKYIIYF